MIYALERVARELADDIKRYDLTVDPHTHAVGNRQGVVVLDPYSSSRKCRATIKHYIKIAKAQERSRELENQAQLF